MDESPRGHEPSDVNVRALFRFGVALVAAAVIVLAGVAGLLVLFSRTADPERRRPLGVAGGGPLPDPRVHADPARELEELVRRDEQLLRSYGWVDRPAGVVRIPVERAMEQVLERGVPKWE